MCSDGRAERLPLRAIERRWSTLSIGKPAPKIHQWTIYFFRWGFGWVDNKAQCFRSARRFGAVSFEADSWHRFPAITVLLGLCLEPFFLCSSTTVIPRPTHANLSPLSKMTNVGRHADVTRTLPFGFLNMEQLLNIAVFFTAPSFLPKLAHSLSLVLIIGTRNKIL